MDKQKALLTSPEREEATGSDKPCRNIIDEVKLLEAQLNKAWDIAKQLGFEVGLEQGKAEGKRELIRELERGGDTN